ncbi:hypothetical protein [Quatrionicoccus australiensis]|uniref:hypothetical protein n=1 Tax=Quatrionicoccus australiensis TaxID=138118 RepID=UPI001CFC4139|nr:hypothetical protein [Quatrionicoccus australiensis]MCB4359575.1 hypothetical protein [Quatrionicoccus australiensis]
MQLISLNILERQHVKLKQGPEQFSTRLRECLANARNKRMRVARRAKGEVNNEARVRTSVQLPDDLVTWLRKLGKQGQLRATVDAALDPADAPLDGGL